jgi:predicted enzyme related to lactoylglutathione lyase
MANLVVHFEIHATKPDRLIGFYSSLFGWRFSQFGDTPYWTIDTGEESIGNVEGQPGMGINGGLTQREGAAPEPGDPVNGCNLVVGVEGDVDTLMQTAIDLGGTEVLPAADMPGVGRVGYLLDPDNNMFGLISPVMSDGTSAMGASTGSAS